MILKIFLDRKVEASGKESKNGPRERDLTKDQSYPIFTAHQETKDGNYTLRLSKCLQHHKQLWCKILWTGVNLFF